MEAAARIPSPSDARADVSNSGNNNNKNNGTAKSEQFLTDPAFLPQMAMSMGLVQLQALGMLGCIPPGTFPHPLSPPPSSTTGAALTPGALLGQGPLGLFKPPAPIPPPPASQSPSLSQDIASTGAGEGGTTSPGPIYPGQLCNKQAPSEQTTVLPPPPTHAADGGNKGHDAIVPMETDSLTTAEVSSRQQQQQHPGANNVISSSNNNNHEHVNNNKTGASEFKRPSSPPVHVLPGLEADHDDHYNTATAAEINRKPVQERTRQKRQTIQDMTRPLKQWLYGHRNNPYPNKSEKVQLARQSQMTLTQVSNWFANARRRLKNTVRGSELTWAKRIKLYNNYVEGNQELLSVGSSSSGASSDEEASGSAAGGIIPAPESFSGDVPMDPEDNSAEHGSGHDTASLRMTAPTTETPAHLTRLAPPPPHHGATAHSLPPHNPRLPTPLDLSKPHPVGHTDTDSLTDRLQELHKQTHDLVTSLFTSPEHVSQPLAGSRPLMSPPPPVSHQPVKSELSDSSPLLSPAYNVPVASSSPLLMVPPSLTQATPTMTLAPPTVTQTTPTLPQTTPPHQSDSLESPPRFKQSMMYRYLNDSCSYQNALQTLGGGASSGGLSGERGGERHRNHSGSLSSHDYEEYMSSASSSRSTPTREHQDAHQYDQYEEFSRHWPDIKDRADEDLYWKEISAALALTSLARSKYNHSLTSTSTSTH